LGFGARELGWTLLNWNANIVLVSGISINAVTLVVALDVDDGAGVPEGGAGGVAGRATGKHFVRSTFGTIARFDALSMDISDKAFITRAGTYRKA